MAHFDLSNPKIIAGLLIGGALPYLIPAIPATLTKWFLLRSVVTGFSPPSGLRLCAVAIAESFCLFVTIEITGLCPWRDIVGFVVAGAVYSVLAMFANLPLFLSVNRHDSASLGKKAPYAFTVGLIYVCYVIPLAYLLSYLVTYSDL